MLVRSFSKDQIVILLLVFGITIAIVNLLRPFHPSLSWLKSSHSGLKPHPQQQWIVEVTGVVRKPGIYTFNNPPTIHKAIQAAGGLMRSRLMFSWGWPELLETGTHLEVKAFDPETVKIIFSRMSVSKRLTLGIPVEVNQAQEEDLALIPGMSQGLARRIVEFRESQGTFKAWHDFRRVKGVGPTNIQRFRDYLNLKESCPFEEKN